MSVRVCCLDWSVVPGGMGWVGHDEVGAEWRDGA
jgi:hypothetical protein